MAYKYNFKISFCTFDVWEQTITFFVVFGSCLFLKNTIKSLMQENIWDHIFVAFLPFRWKLWWEVRVAAN